MNASLRDQALVEIKRLASADGRGPSIAKFELETGISKGRIIGVFWARWGDALSEAGFEPNEFGEDAIDEEFLFEKLAVCCRHYGHKPTQPERNLFRRSNIEMPTTTTYRKRLGSFGEQYLKLLTWCDSKENWSDVKEMLIADLRINIPKHENPKFTAHEGLVYLLKSGPNFKIGRSDQIERRVKQISTALPDKAELVHSIRTDDPPGIEAYWHRRFADKRANGEWFKLTHADVSAFRKRIFQ